jgi:hypothetical protein
LQDSTTNSLAFVASVTNEGGACVHVDVDVLVTLFQLDLLPAELLTFADVSADGRATARADKAGVQFFSPEERPGH